MWVESLPGARRSKKVAKSALVVAIAAIVVDGENKGLEGHCREL